MYAQNEKIVPINVADEMSKSFLDYSMSVIVSRALPDARDGLKPVHRRVLYAMNRMGLQHTKKHTKCAKVVGETMGNYHPHGDSAIYDTLVRMAQPFSLRCTMVDGKGNFGSMDGDPPAAMRYTECRMSRIASEMLADIDMETVNMTPNYDESTVEPEVLPSGIPNLLVNGGTGIAVGMATNMPPHNLGEAIDAVCAQIDNPDIELKELMKLIPGPDFPTGGIICGTTGIENYFRTGKGSVKLRGRIGVEEGRAGKEQLVITEVPYNMNPEEFIKHVADLAEEKKLEGISDVRNESTEVIRLVIELKRDAIAKVVIANLYKHTTLETSFPVTMLALDHRRPKILPLKDLINCYIEHRREVVVRRTKYSLRIAEDRAHILEGFKIALANLDDFVKIIRSSTNRDDAKEKLQKKFDLSDRQVNAILELRLYQLTGLERDKIEKEYLEVIQLIEELKSILASERKVLNIIKKELRDIREKYADPRRSQIVPDEGEINIEDLIANERCVITITHAGYIKRTSVASFRAQRRGGKGVLGMRPKEETQTNAAGEDSNDFVEHGFTASAHDFLMFFTNSGRVYVEKVYNIPEMGRAAKGKSLANVLQMQPDEKVADLICVKEFSEAQHLVMATASGVVKKTNLADYKNFRAGGIIAIKIEEGDQLIGSRLTNGTNEIVLVTYEGMSIRFHEEELRDQGRATVGVYGIRPEKNDRVIGLAVVDSEATLLVAGENGIGKRTQFDEYRSQARGGKGIITMKTTEKTGGVVGVLSVKDSDEIMLLTLKGQAVRIPAAGVRLAGRNTQGVILVNLEDDDKLQAIAPVAREEGEDDQQPDLPLNGDATEDAAKSDPAP